MLETSFGMQNPKARGRVGGGVFRYAFEPFQPPEPFGAAWLLRFYDHKTFFCTTASDCDITLQE